MNDLLFTTEARVFSCRAAAVIVHDGKVLLQHLKGAPDFAFPGGHVRFGETSAEALVREIREETGAEIVPGKLLWLAETFFPWDARRACHQIGMYYLAELEANPPIPTAGSFDTLDAEVLARLQLEFCWVDLPILGEIRLYPTFAAERLTHSRLEFEHFIYRE